MRAEDEGPVGGPRAVGGPSATAVLAVAEGLRRHDPQLSAALAEHAARLSHDDARRGEAELSAVLARRELDRPEEVASRGVPALREAELGGRDRAAAVLRCALADAALTWSDTAVAEALIGPLAAGSGLPDHLRLVLAVARADLAAALGDPTTVDALAGEVETLAAVREEQLLARADVERARARARATRGDLGGARELLASAVEEPVPDAVDGGRRRLLVLGDLLEVLVALDDPVGARAMAAPVLEHADGPTTALPLARVRCLTAAAVHLPGRELSETEALARTVVDGLSGGGHDRRVAAAEEVLAAVAEARGDLSAALASQRRALHLERAALSSEAAVRVELASAAAAVADPGTAVGAAARGRRSHAAGARTGATGNGVHPLAAAERPRTAEAPAPHGLSRILDEITADLPSTPVDSADHPRAATPETPDEYAEELRLTLVDLLAEYSDDLGGVTATRPLPARGADGARPASASPTAWSFHTGPAEHPDRDGHTTVPGVGDTAEVDSGARLADLLADAMDAFRRSAPGTGTIGPVPPERTESRGARR